MHGLTVQNAVFASSDASFHVIEGALAVAAFMTSLNESKPGASSTVSRPRFLFFFGVKSDDVY